MCDRLKTQHHQNDLLSLVGFVSTSTLTVFLLNQTLKHCTEVAELVLPYCKQASTAEGNQKAQLDIISDQYQKANLVEEVIGKASLLAKRYRSRLGARKVEEIERIHDVFKQLSASLLKTKEEISNDLQHKELKSQEAMADLLAEEARQAHWQRVQRSVFQKKQSEKVKDLESTKSNQSALLTKKTESNKTPSRQSDLHVETPDNTRMRSYS